MADYLTKLQREMIMIVACSGGAVREFIRGRSEMCDLFLKAVREAIDRWTEVNDEVDEEDE